MKTTLEEIKEQVIKETRYVIMRILSFNYY